MLKRASWVFSVLFAVSSPAAAQVPSAGAQVVPSLPAETPVPPVDAGIPVESALVRQKCGTCHRVSEGNLMTRISYRRASPENWEKTIKRMVALNGATVEPAEAREILKYLSDHNGLAPEEARPVAFDYERRLIEYTYEDKPTAATCTGCHSIGRVMSERRTKDEWQLLVTMHRGFYPLVDNQPMSAGQGFRRSRRAATEPNADGSPIDTRQPMDIAIEHLAKAFPLRTPEWTGWTATMQTPRLAGKWALTGYQLGEGAVYGVVTIAEDPGSAGGFTTDTSYRTARTGTTVSRQGKATVYTGYQWRGRDTAGGANAEAWREVMFLERTGGEMWGRWFTGAYDETGIDVKLVRIGSDPLITGTSAVSIKAGGKAVPLHVYGENLPSSVTPAMIGLGSGVTVSRVVSATPRELTLELEVAATATTGPRDLTVAATVLPKALIVYDHIDGIRITPEAGMARIGGIVFPKGFQQFEAVAFHNGPDGKPNTKDDLNLGRVDAKWSVEEYSATFGDDDVKWVGVLGSDGRFTPNVDGPNPERVGNRNNIGDVWVVADYTPEGGKPMRARAFLLVTVPLYMNWLTSEAGS